MYSMENINLGKMVYFRYGDNIYIITVFSIVVNYYIQY